MENNSSCQIEEMLKEKELKNITTKNTKIEYKGDIEIWTKDVGFYNDNKDVYVWFDKDDAITFAKAILDTYHKLESDSM